MSHLKNRRGQGLVEYILVLVLMALLSVGAIRALGEKSHNAFVQAGSTMDKSTQQATNNGDSSQTIPTN